MTDAPKPAEVARQWFEQIWRQRDHTAVHRLMAADAVGFLEPDVEVAGPDHFVTIFHSLFETFPDLDMQVEGIVGDDQSAVVRWCASATHNGTGKQVTFRGMTWLDIKDGLVVGGRDSWNQGALATTLASA